MGEIVYSDEQKDIFEYVEKGVLNVSVQAVAGAGKTTTLVECIKRLPADKKILVLAHNRLAKDTLKDRIGEVKNIMIYTIHGLSWRLFTEHFGESPNIVEDKYRIYINHNLKNIVSEEYNTLPKIKQMIYKSNVFDLIDKARYNLKQSEKEIRKLAIKKYGLNIILDEPRVVSEILKWGTEHRETVDYQDMLSFPYEFGYFTKKYLADYVFLDEAQDASLAQQNVISRCFKRNTRFIYFGDKDQSINNWCGSDTEAFEHLEDRDTFGRESKQFPLTTNYRCGTKIIEYAKQYTDNNIHAREGAGPGEVNMDVKLSTAKDGDMILCRNIAPLMKVYRWGVTNGKKMYFRGAELGRILRNSIDSVGGDTVEEIILNLKQSLIAIWNYQTEKMGVDERESMYAPQVTSLMDTIKTMESLPKTVDTKAALDGFIKTMFLDEESNGIQLSTIHRAKGLEADNVFVVCPSLIPSAMAKLPWQIEEERHLLYVMSTRPKNTLNFVSENDVKPNNALLNGVYLYKDLCDIRNFVESHELPKED